VRNINNSLPGTEISHHLRPLYYWSYRGLWD